MPPRHSVLNQWALLEPLGIEPPDRARDPVTMTPDAGRGAARRRAAAAGRASTDDAPLIVLHVSAGNPFRRWPAQSFAAAAASLAAADPIAPHHHHVRPLGRAPPPKPWPNDARRLAGDAADGIVRTGEFDLAELRALVDRAALYIGGDSGPLHIAATTRTPVVALFGPTLPERSMPWRDPAIGAIAVDAGPLPCRPCHQRHCVPGDFRCLTMISPNMVVAAAEQLLADHS